MKMGGARRKSEHETGTSQAGRCQLGLFPIMAGPITSCCVWEGCLPVPYLHTPLAPRCTRTRHLHKVGRVRSLAKRDAVRRTTTRTGTAYRPWAFVFVASPRPLLILLLVRLVCTSLAVTYGWPAAASNKLFSFFSLSATSSPSCARPCTVPYLILPPRPDCLCCSSHTRDNNSRASLISSQPHPFCAIGPSNRDTGYSTPTRIFPTVVLARPERY